MKKIFLLLMIVVGVMQLQAQTTFEKIIDTLGIISATSIQETFDHGYAICGNLLTGGNYLAKLDTVGNIKWISTFSYSVATDFNAVNQLSDSGYLVNGDYNISQSTQNWKIRFNKNGDTLWTSKFSFGSAATNGYNTHSIAGMQNNLFASTGYYSMPLHQTCFISNDLFGNTQSNRTYPLTIHCSGNSICTTPNGFMISGTRDSIIYGWVDIIRIDQQGDTILRKKYGTRLTQASYSIIPVNDHEYLSGGLIRDSISGLYNMYLLKIDSNCNQLWDKEYHFGDNQVINDLDNCLDGNFVVTGTLSPSLDQKFLIMKCNAVGDTLWTKIFGSDSCHNIGYDVHATHDGGVIACGVGCMGNHFGAYIIKTDSMGLVHAGVGIKGVNNPYNFTVSPNPNHGVFSVTANCFSGYSSTIKIYNTANQLVYSNNICNNTPQEIDLSNAPAGLYIIILSNGVKMVSKKVVVE